MASSMLSVQDKNDLDKFSKYLVYKCVQIIVQSRLGEKVKTKSKAFSTGSDWFNLSVMDISDVKAETVKVFNGSLNVGQTICVEISLKTSDGETMVLENWSLALIDQPDPNVSGSYTIYNRMGVLLKSLFSVSRATPSYRLSRKQGSETFVICYRIYMAEPQKNHLGDGYQNRKLGGVPTPIGTFVLSIAYRTKMLISPHTSTKDLGDDLRENHFNSESSPRKINSPKPCHNGYRVRRYSATEDGMVFGDIQDICTTNLASSPSDSHFYHYSTTPPPHTHWRPRKPSGDSIKSEENKENITRPATIHNGPKICAFHPEYDLSWSHTDEEELPFARLLRPPIHPEKKKKVSEEVDHKLNSLIEIKSPGSNHSHHSADSSAPEDFVLVELNCPFATPDESTELEQFYLGCQRAPPLAMFQEIVTVEETLNTITDQLANFEASAKEYDDFVNSLTASDG